YDPPLLLHTSNSLVAFTANYFREASSVPRQGSLKPKLKAANCWRPLDRPENIFVAAGFSLRGLKPATGSILSERSLARRNVCSGRLKPAATGVHSFRTLLGG